MENTKNFGSNLRSEINKKGYKTYKKAADAFGISLSYLNQLMRNEREPSLELLNIISAKLEVPHSVLLGESAKPSLSSETHETATLILEIQSLLTKLSLDDLEIVKMTAEGCLKMSIKSNSQRVGET